MHVVFKVSGHTQARSPLQPRKCVVSFFTLLLSLLLCASQVRASKWFNASE